MPANPGNIMMHTEKLGIAGIDLSHVNLHLLRPITTAADRFMDFFASMSGHVRP
jgi:hypothetical protein